ncbi:MAG: NAD(P)H-dependent oxidoreductase subunit E [Candidatus Polarisedimenticolaceae bacterium]|nr:NAD(P)H-dependent oxidoreductase subunit E [Candidatus Polarisedimenticolaceae bacterium]
MQANIETILEYYNLDKTRLMDILWEVQQQQGFVSSEAVEALSKGLNMSSHDIRETLTFYHFFLDGPSGKHKIYLADTVIARMCGYAEVRAALEQACGCAFGAVDESGAFGLYDTNCIGLSDQEPAMMVDEVVFTRLTPEKVKDIITRLRQGASAEEVANPDRKDRRDAAYVDTLTSDNIRVRGPVFFKAGRDYPALLAQVLELLPDEVIEEVSLSGIRGRGGAGFPTGLKWRLGRDAEGEEKYVICNADEGEPGTFKDRVLLTRSPGDVLLGVIIAAWAIGSRQGIIYLRAEYWYLKEYLEQQIQAFHDAGLLGKQILGRDFDFDIRIQMGAGAYVCGDETALIESCEGKRGTPRIKPPYPIQQGYLGMPTCVNNVETFAAISRILEQGGAWFSAMGTDESTGTRLLSVSGDCEHPGIYETEWGITLDEVLKMAGAKEPMAVQVSGPSGECVSAEQDGSRLFCYSDLSCNGSLMIFDQSRNLLDIVENFLRFFVDESCGICVPCRVGGVNLYHKIRLINAGRGSSKDLDDIRSWGSLMRETSRCGLGTTAAKPLLTTLEKFSELYQQKMARPEGVLLASFDLEGALQGHEQARRTLVQEEKQ